MKINKNFIIKHVLDEDVLIDVSGKFKGIIKLNETSSYIFKCLQDGDSLEEIINNVTREYKVDLVTASKDVSDFLNKLEDLKIIKQ